MNEALLVSNVLLWCVVIVLALVVLALARQVGVLHERVAPAGALMPTTGPKVGEQTEAETVRELDGSELTVGGPAEPLPSSCGLHRPARCAGAWSRQRCRWRDRSGCGSCSPATANNSSKHRAYVRDLQLQNHPYVVSATLGMRYAVSKLPFAALIGADGVLRSKGLVNTREHLESLVESMQSGVQSLQDYVGGAEAQGGKTPSGAVPYDGNSGWSNRRGAGWTGKPATAAAHWRARPRAAVSSQGSASC